MLVQKPFGLKLYALHLARAWSVLSFRWTPNQEIVTVRDNDDYIRVLQYISVLPLLQGWGGPLSYPAHPHSVLCVIAEGTMAGSTKMLAIKSRPREPTPKSPSQSGMSPKSCRCTVALGLGFRGLGFWVSGPGLGAQSFGF